MIISIRSDHRCEPNPLEHFRCEVRKVTPAAYSEAQSCEQ